MVVFRKPSPARYVPPSSNVAFLGPKLTDTQVTFVDRYGEGYYPGWIRCVDPAADAPQDALPTFQIKIPTKIGVEPMPEEWKTIRVANKENSARMVWGESDDTPILPLQMYQVYS